MKIMVITASPNKDGLTAACGEEACQGAASAGAEVSLVCLNDLKVDVCRACERGWGTCREKHYCQLDGNFEKLHSEMSHMDGFVIITPVYWGEMSESAKAVTDKLRRCEALRNEESLFNNKPVICVAAAGGSGNGCNTCLGSMERFVDHTRGIKFDSISITRRSRKYKLSTIREAVKGLAESLQG